MAKKPSQSSVAEIEDSDSEGSATGATGATDRDAGADVVMVGGMDDGEEQVVEVDVGLTEQEQEVEQRAKPQERAEERDAYGDTDDDEDERLGHDEDAHLSRRQRRNRGRRQAIEQRDQVITSLQTELQQMRGQIAGLAQGHVGVIATTVETQLQNAIRAAQMADDEFAKAVAAQDEKAIKEFRALSREADLRVATLQNAKQRLEQQAAQQRQQVEQRPQQPQQRQQGTPDPAAERLANIFMDRHPWFNPDGKDEDSVLVRALDDALAADGYQPNTPAHWRELERRVKARGIGQNGDGMDDDREERRQEPQRERRGIPPTGAVRSTRAPGKQTMQLSRTQMEYLEMEGLVGENYAALRGDEKKAADEKRGRITTKWRQGLADLRRSSGRA